MERACWVPCCRMKSLIDLILGMLTLYTSCHQFTGRESRTRAHEGFPAALLMSEKLDRFNFGDAYAINVLSVATSSRPRGQN